MFSTILLALAAATTPANDPASSAASAAASRPAPAATAPTARKPTQYCIVDTLTGSRIPYRTCKTRDEWLARGFDPLADK